MKLLFVLSLFYCFLHLVQGTCNTDTCSTPCNNDGFLFEFVSTKLNYYDAQAECLGSTRFGDDVTAIGLAIVDTEAIKDELVGLESRDSKRAWIGAIATNIGGKWVYGFDIVGDFREIQDNDEANGFWARNEPNGKGKQNCVQTNYKKGGQWDDAGCHIRKAYFCQYNCAVSIPTTSTPAAANIELISTTETPRGNSVDNTSEDPEAILKDSTTKSPNPNLIMDSTTVTSIMQKEVSSITEAHQFIVNYTTKARTANNQDSSETSMTQKEVSSTPEVMVNNNITKASIADNQDSTNETPNVIAPPNAILEEGTSKSPNANSVKVSTTEISIAEKEVSFTTEDSKVIVDSNAAGTHIDDQNKTNEAPKSDLPSAILKDGTTESPKANLAMAYTVETSITQKEVSSTTEAPEVIVNGNTIKAHTADNQDNTNEVPKSTALSNTILDDDTAKSPEANSVITNTTETSMAQGEVSSTNEAPKVEINTTEGRTADNQDSPNDAPKSTELPRVSLEDLITKSRKLINLVMNSTLETSIAQESVSSTTETPRVIVDGSITKASIAYNQDSNFETPKAFMSGNTTEPPTADNDDSITEATEVRVIVDSSATEALGAKEEGSTTEIPRAAVEDSTTQVPKLFEALTSTQLPKAGPSATTEVPRTNDEATTSRYSRLRRSRRPWLKMVSN